MADVAWHVDNGEHAAIVFAATAESALRRGMARLPSDVPEDLTASRAEQYDQYAEAGEVPFEVLIENGWIFTCDHCGGEIDQETDEGSRRCGRLTFCCQRCQDNHAERVQEVNAEFEAFRGLVAARFPELTVTEFQGGWPILTPVARFTFPGALYGGGHVKQERDGTLRMSVASGDLDAWEAFRSQAPKAGHEAES